VRLPKANWQTKIVRARFGELRRTYPAATSGSPANARRPRRSRRIRAARMPVADPMSEERKVKLSSALVGGPPRGRAGGARQSFAFFLKTNEAVRGEFSGAAPRRGLLQHRRRTDPSRRAPRGEVKAHTLMPQECGQFGRLAANGSVPQRRSAAQRRNRERRGPLLSPSSPRWKPRAFPGGPRERSRRLLETPFRWRRIDVEQAPPPRPAAPANARSLQQPAAHLDRACRSIETSLKGCWRCAR